MKIPKQRTKRKAKVTVAVNHHLQTTPARLERDTAAEGQRSWDYLAMEDSVAEDWEDTD